jgi:5'-AMP-activated protein kinase catalytic alpha subunit
MSNNVIEAHENSQPEKNEKNEYKIPQYEFTRTLGSGTFGKVMAAIHIPSQENVAIKIIDKETLKDEDDLKRVEREVEIMKIIRHPNIIQFYEMIETEKQIFLVIEYAESG